MKVIDFDSQFSKYAEKWMMENRSKYKNMDEMEDDMPEVYLRWLNTPAPWLDGKTPGAYFADCDDAHELVNLLSAYHNAHVSAPDVLLERIVELGDSAVTPLMTLAAAQHSREETVTALNLLIELNAQEPMDMCMDIIDQCEAQNELTDVAAELLTGLGEVVISPIISRMDGAKKPAKEAFLDILCNFPGDERIYNYAVEAFNHGTGNKALYASYLGKLGDERAIDVLRPALTLDDINYLDYIEIVGAIEALGGEVTDSRDFNGDPYYESLRKMQ